MTETLTPLESRPRPRPAGFPVSPDLIPKEPFGQRGFQVSFARDRAELEAAQRLRFDVFNVELGEGLDASYATGLDAEPLDDVVHHLLVRREDNGEVIGTYRMQTGGMAKRNLGFYTAGEFDLSGFPESAIRRAVEVGRACIAKPYRKRRVLELLWRGLAQYLEWTGNHYIFGCCSLTSQDEGAGIDVHDRLCGKGRLHPTLRANPLPGMECRRAPGCADQAPFPIPPLFQSYLNLGASICGPPAIDRDFKTIDFLVVLDTRTLPPIVRKTFFRR